MDGACCPRSTATTRSPPTAPPLRLRMAPRTAPRYMDSSTPLLSTMGTPCDEGWKAQGVRALLRALRSKRESAPLLPKSKPAPVAITASNIPCVGLALTGLRLAARVLRAARWFRWPSFASARSHSWRARPSSFRARSRAPTTTRSHKGARRCTLIVLFVLLWGPHGWLDAAALNDGHSLATTGGRRKGCARSCARSAARASAPPLPTSFPPPSPSPPTTFPRTFPASAWR